MNNLMASNVFFFVTTIVEVIIAGLIIAILIYMLRIFRQIKKETDLVVKDVSLFRKFVERLFGKKEKKK